MTRCIQTVGVISIRSIIDIDVQAFVTPQCSCQELDLLVALNSTSFGVCSALTIALHGVEFHHLLYAIFVLLLYAKLELELGKHELDSRAEVLSIGFHEVWNG